MVKLCFLALIFLQGCSALKKDNPVREPKSSNPALAAKLATYLELSESHLDAYGLATGGGLGDAALFSCLLRAAGGKKFDVALLFTDSGKPLRHPEIARKFSKTPISKDMLNGIMWCLYTHEDPGIALALIDKMVTYGRDHKTVTGQWIFCSDQDKLDYQISDKDFLGRCIMTPAVSKDVYRIATKFGYACDEGCKLTMQAGANLPVDAEEFAQHLSVITTVRNGLVEGALNDNSLNLLKQATIDQPRNALYHAAFNLFSGGDQQPAWDILMDESLFPNDRLPDSTNFCTDYLFQRDETQTKEFTADADGCIDYFDPNTKAPVKECDLASGSSNTRRTYNDDWLPCAGGHPKTGIDFIFAAALSLGKIR